MVTNIYTHNIMCFMCLITFLSCKNASIALSVPVENSKMYHNKLFNIHNAQYIYYYKCIDLPPNCFSISRKVLINCLNVFPSCKN